MGDGRWQRLSMVLLVPAAAAVALSGCSGSGTASAKAAAATGFSAAQLKSALLTKVNGVGAQSQPTSGKYAGLAASNAGKTAGGVTVKPAACASSATEGFDPSALAGASAATVSFKVTTNTVSEVLVDATAKSGTAALAGSVPAQCAKYQEKVDGKTFTYALTEGKVSGIGQQAKALNVKSASSASDEQWSLIFRGKGFVGTVAVVGPNASEKAVRELGQQAYAFAAKSLS